MHAQAVDILTWPAPPPFQVLAPFRAITLRRLPRGTVFRPLPVGSELAVLALEDVVRTQAETIMHVLLHSPDATARLQRLEQVYTGSARLGLRALTATDWSPAGPWPVGDLAHVAPRLAEIAHTPSALRACAMHVGAAWFAALRRAHPHPAGAMLQDVRDEAARLAALADQVARRCWTPDRADAAEPRALLPILRPRPDGTPLLAAIPCDRLSTIAAGAFQRIIAEP
jgi:hypothetical protein